MDIAPGFPAFASAYEAGKAQALYVRLIADLEPPVSAFLKLAGGRDNAFLLESVQGGETRGRYSVIGLKPDLIWRCRNGAAEINRNVGADPERFVADADADAPLMSLKRLVGEAQMELPPELPPMAVGLFGYLGYYIVRPSVRLPSPAPQCFGRAFPLPPFAFSRALRRLNPSPFLYFLNFPGFAIVGSSPEILVRLRDGKVTIRPIAGTRPRGKTADEDAKLAEELMVDPKERAEHLMLLDLGRNDVGRVAMTGTVRVTDQFFLERYSHVMHLVSNVEGSIRPGFDSVDALVAGFPAGTLSGAPKVRAMEIIDELEKEKRGVYAGAVGYFAANGTMDTCIVLRTAVVKDGVMYVQAGGGVVADSNPESELQETVSKAKALMAAADEAVRYASMPKRGQ